MKIQIQNYLGHDILTLSYNEKNVNVSKDRIKEIDDISTKFGYNITIDLDKDCKPYLMVKCMNIDNSEEYAKTQLLNLISELNKTFL